MEQQEKRRTAKQVFYKAGQWTLVVFALLVVAGVIGGSLSSSTSTPAPQTIAAQPPSFSQKARARFDEILKSSPELADITCESNDCTYVAYFDYKSVPDDLDFVMRGNAATFSKFKLDNTGVSNVTVVARKNDNVLMTCDAAQGKVKECQ